MAVFFSPPPLKDCNVVHLGTCVGVGVGSGCVGVGGCVGCAVVWLVVVVVSDVGDVPGV